MARKSIVPPGIGLDGVSFVRATLRGYGGRAPVGTTFFEALGLKKRVYEKMIPDPGGPAEFVLFATRAGLGAGGKTPADPVKHFEAGFLRAARWLLSRPRGAFDRWREQGRRADVLIELSIRSYQVGRLDYEPTLLLMPTQFLLACGGAGLPLVFNSFS
jgi:hypothetical protein